MYSYLSFARRDFCASCAVAAAPDGCLEINRCFHRVGIGARVRILNSWDAAEHGDGYRHAVDRGRGVDGRTTRAVSPYERKSRVAIEVVVEMIGAVMHEARSVCERSAFVEKNGNGTGT